MVGGFGMGKLGKMVRVQVWIDLYIVIDEVGMACRLALEVLG